MNKYRRIYSLFKQIINKNKLYFFFNGYSFIIVFLFTICFVSGWTSYLTSFLSEMYFLGCLSITIAGMLVVITQGGYIRQSVKVKIILFINWSHVEYSVSWVPRFKILANYKHHLYMIFVYGKINHVTANCRMYII